MKIVMIIALILVAGFIQAEDSSWLSVEWAFQLGWIPKGNITYYGPSTPLEESPIYNKFDILFEILFTGFGFIEIGGNCKTYFANTENLYFLPTGIDYSFNAGVVFGNISFTYFHSCTHPTIANFIRHNSSSYSFLDSGFDRFYFEYRTSF